MKDLLKPEKARRHAPPANAIEALLRLRATNKQTLAKDLGCSPVTLRRWIAEGPSAIGERLISELLISTLRAADHTDDLAQWSIDWTKRHKDDTR